MPVTSLLAAAAAAFLAGLGYAYVAWRLLRRQVDDKETAFAMRCFSLWWGALAINLTSVSILDALAAFGLLTFPVQLFGSGLQRVLLAASLVGLMAYFLFLLTGRARFPAIATLYLAYLVLLMTSLTYQEPTDVAVHAFRTDLTFTRSAPAWSDLASFALILVPPVVASLAYLRLVPKAGSRTQRYRIAAVSTSILVWWVVTVVAGQRALLDHAGIQIAARSLGAGAAFFVLSAFAPPPWMQRRFGLQAMPGRT